MKLFALFVVFLVAVLAHADVPSITLPPDAEIVNIVGNGFKLQVNQLVQMKSDWQAVTDDLEKDKKAEQNIEGKGASATDSQKDQAQAEPGQDAAAASGAEKDYGYLEEDLHTWIEDRATALADRVERYSEEIGALKQGQRVVSQVLLLNTLNDLENLNKENIKSLKWIKNKLRWIMAVRDGVNNEVSNWVSLKIEENRKIEPKVRGKNDPGLKWLTNVQSIKRLMLEQRFSEEIKDSIVDYLGGEFNMMERNRVYEINKPAKILDDGLYYYQARGRIPAYFPFFAQDSIVNGAQL